MNIPTGSKTVFRIVAHDLSARMATAPNTRTDDAEVGWQTTLVHLGRWNDATDSISESAMTVSKKRNKQLCN